MFELPLFPLHSVLFPGLPLNLHIFEERYKRMIRLCLESRQPFGVVLIKHGFEALGPLAEPYPVGCTAKIIQAQPLEDGRMNITALGQERFRILSLDYNNQPYLIGSVERYPLLNVDPKRVKESGQHLRAWVERYFVLLAQTGASQLDLQQLPGDAVSLAYLAASLAQVQLIQKQKYLSIPDATELVAQIITLYQREVALLKMMLLHHVKEKGIFSLN